MPNIEGSFTLGYKTFHVGLFVGDFFDFSSHFVFYDLFCM